MSSAPLKVPVIFGTEHQPLVDALKRCGCDIGSVATSRVAGMVRREMREALADWFDDPNARVLCVATADKPEMTRVLDRLRVELERVRYAEMGRLLLLGGPMDTALAVFLDIPTLRVG